MLIPESRVIQNPYSRIVTVFLSQIVQIVAVFDDFDFRLALDGVAVDGFILAVNENRRAFAEVGDKNGVGAVRVGGMHGVRLFRLRPLRGVGRVLNTAPTTLPAYFLRRGILFTDTRPSET